MKKRIAVFINAWMHEYADNALKSLDEIAKKENVDFYVLSTYIFPGTPVGNIEQLDLYKEIELEKFDGALVFASTLVTDEEQNCVYKKITNSQIPAISVDVKFFDLNYVITDNKSGIAACTEHLIKNKNVKDIVFISGYENNTESIERESAVRETASRLGANVLETIYGLFGTIPTETKIAKWLENNKLPDAFICANDLMAIGAINYLKKINVRVPEDVIVTGFDHSTEGLLYKPSLASVSRNTANSIKIACEKLLNGEKNVNLQFETTFIPSESSNDKISDLDVQRKIDIMQNYCNSIIQHSSVDIYYHDLVDTTNTSFVRDAIKNLKHFLIERKVYNEEIKIYLKNSFFNDCIENDFLCDVIKTEHFSNPVTIEKDDTFKNDYEKGYVFTVINSRASGKSIGYFVIKDGFEFLATQGLWRLETTYSEIFNRIKQSCLLLQTQNELEKMCITDNLSGLYNRHGCYKFATNFINEGKEKGLATNIYFIDINKMKSINDICGHANGDLAIKIVADVIKELGPNDIGVRYGGDEFLVFSTSNDKDKTYIANFKEKLKEHRNKKEFNFNLSVSIGKIVVPIDSQEDIEYYINVADKKMYAEKTKSNN